jgi:transcriptional regulator with XRE-family HTH domain
MKLITHEEIKRELMKDPEFARLHTAPDLVYEIGQKVKRLRIQCGFSQATLAKKLGTKQSSIARLECGAAGLPSLSFLKRIADATGTALIIPSFSKILPKNLVRVEHS